ncbi:3'-5' exonuclease [Marinigracilibium pacificum]|uniref:3'-5' exonuclease n=1 Tax=Marinigracilibium pacificum TaxID=2729599 RepID=A0A848J0A4_9BACT|nr:3'-5' exonuclease [Marinigracilibium pacificum]NMM47980.1 3'-5' exonuclease [Marinigracilibium pacificum]
MLKFLKNILGINNDNRESLSKDALDYLELFSTNNSSPKNQFVVLDTETTGLDTSKDNIISFGAVKIQDQKIVLKDSIYLFILPEKELNKQEESAIVHGLSQKEVTDFGISEYEAAKQILKFISNYTIIAHHAAFDIKMINNLIYKNLGIKIKNNSIDTFDLAVKKDFGRLNNVNFNPANYSLDKLLSKYNIPPYDRHNALGDSILTAKLFLILTS